MTMLSRSHRQQLQKRLHRLYGDCAADLATRFEAMLGRYGDSWKEQVFDGHILKPDVVVLVNGLNIHQMEGLSTSLAAVDRIDILPMFEGG